MRKTPFSLSLGKVTSANLGEIIFSRETPTNSGRTTSIHPSGQGQRHARARGQGEREPLSEHATSFYKFFARPSLSSDVAVDSMREI